MEYVDVSVVDDLPALPETRPHYVFLTDLQIGEHHRLAGGMVLRRVPLLVVLHVRSFDFFHFGLTEVHFASPSVVHLKGRQFQSLAQAVTLSK